MIGSSRESDTAASMVGGILMIDSMINNAGLATQKGDPRILREEQPRMSSRC